VIVSESLLNLKVRGPLKFSDQGLANMEAAQAAWLRSLDPPPAGLGPGSSALQQVCVAVGNPATSTDAAAMVDMHVHDTYGHRPFTVQCLCSFSRARRNGGLLRAIGLCRRRSSLSFLNT